MNVTQFDVMHFYRELSISARWRTNKMTTIIKTSWMSNHAIFGEWKDEAGEHDFEWYDDTKNPKTGWHDIKPILRHTLSMTEEEENEWNQCRHKVNGRRYDTNESALWLIKNGFDAFNLIERNMAIDRDGVFEKIHKAAAIEAVRPSRLFRKPTDGFVNECPHYWWMLRKSHRALL